MWAVTPLTFTTLFFITWELHKRKGDISWQKRSKNQHILSCVGRVILVLYRNIPNHRNLGTKSNTSTTHERKFELASSKDVRLSLLIESWFLDSAVTTSLLITLSTLIATFVHVACSIRDSDFDSAPFKASRFTLESRAKQRNYYTLLYNDKANRSPPIFLISGLQYRVNRRLALGPNLHLPRMTEAL
jgi:hypothetical protein